MISVHIGRRTVHEKCGIDVITLQHPTRGSTCHGCVFNHIILNDLSQFLGVGVYALVFKGAYMLFITEVPE